MPTKIAPQPSSTATSEREGIGRYADSGNFGEEGGRGGGGGGGTRSKPGTKPTTTTNKNNNSNARPAKLFNTSRFRSHFTTTMAKGFHTTRRSVLSVFLITGICLVLLVLGIFMVYIGDEKYIVDVIVLGALCLGMAVTSCVLGMILVLRPLYKIHKQLEEEAEEEGADQPPTASALPASSSRASVL